ncbi:DUF444 family protein, partial [Burkholderia gladioli]
MRGDKIPRPPGGSGGGGSQASNEGEGQDDFVFELSRDEFMQYFFDDLELPRLVKTHLLTVPSWKSVRAGWAAEGTPNNIDVVRSLRSALGRRIALGSPLVNELRVLEAQLEELKADTADRRVEIAELEAQIHHLRTDLAYPLHRPIRPALRESREAAATLEPGRDVLPDGRVGLEDEQRKDLAKRFFILLYLFLKRNYERIE